jgi:hypothetical protein
MSAHLGYKRDELSKVSRLFIGVCSEDAANRIIVIPLLQELFLVRFWVPFNQVLKLG